MKGLKTPGNLLSSAKKLTLINDILRHCKQQIAKTNFLLCLNNVCRSANEFEKGLFIKDIRTKLTTSSAKNFGGLIRDAQMMNSYFGRIAHV